MAYFFRCKSNPNAALLKLDQYWEAKEMKGHPDYQRVDEFGDDLVDEEDEAEQTIPMR